MKNALLLIVSGLFFSGDVFPEGNGSDVRMHFLTPPRIIFELPSRIDPDEPLFEYSSVAGTWSAKAGGAVTLFGLESQSVNLCFSLNSFFNLYNFAENQPISWEAMRVDVGIMTFWEFPPLNALLFAGARLFLEVGLFHQDGNVADIIGYETLFLNTSLFSLDFGMFNSFEYVLARLTWIQPLFDGAAQFFISGGFKKIGSVLVGDYSIRDLDASLSAEGGVKVRLAADPRIDFWVCVFVESIMNHFVSNGAENPEFIAAHDGGDFFYFGIDAGLELRYPGGFSARPFIGYTYHHGRGVDFLKLYQGLEWGVKFSL